MSEETKNGAAKHTAGAAATLESAREVARERLAEISTEIDGLNAEQAHLLELLGETPVAASAKIAPGPIKKAKGGKKGPKGPREGSLTTKVLEYTKKPMTVAVIAAGIDVDPKKVSQVVLGQVKKKAMKKTGDRGSFMYQSV